MQNFDVGYTVSKPQPKDSRKLESWPPGEPGAAPYLRPQALPLERPGVEVIDPSTRPIDVLGDIVSHFMINSDPTIKDIYGKFQKSLTSQQMDRLRSQYKWSRVHERENRSFSDWLKTSGLPAYFRGRPFQQWKNVPDNWYTPQQLQLFDQMMKYLGSTDGNPIGQRPGPPNGGGLDQGNQPAIPPGVDR